MVTQQSNKTINLWLPGYLTGVEVSWDCASLRFLSFVLLFIATVQYSYIFLFIYLFVYVFSVFVNLLICKVLQTGIDLLIISNY